MKRPGRLSRDYISSLNTRPHQIPKLRERIQDSGILREGKSLSYVAIDILPQSSMGIGNRKRLLLTTVVDKDIWERDFLLGPRTGYKY